MKIKKIISSCLVVLMLAVMFTSCASKETLTLVQEKSKIYNYTVEDDQVEYLVQMTIKNNSSEDIQFYVRADFTKDKNDGFIEDDILYGSINDKGNVEKVEYSIKPNEEKPVIIEFYAKSTGMEERPSKSLPDNIVFEIIK